MKKRRRKIKVRASTEANDTIGLEDKATINNIFFLLALFLIILLKIISSTKQKNILVLIN